LASKRDQKRDQSADSLLLEKIYQSMLLINELPHSIISFGLIKENYISVDSKRVTLQDRIVFIMQKCKT